MYRTLYSIILAVLIGLLLIVTANAVVRAEEAETPTMMLVQDNPLQDLQVAEGTGVTVGSATPCDCGSATLTLAIPPEASVKQVLLYWYGGLRNNQSPPEYAEIDQGIVLPPASLLRIDGVRIGGPTAFYMRGGEPVYFSAFRADVTEMTTPWFSAGMTSTITIDLPFVEAETIEEAAGMLVIYDDGSKTQVLLKEGMDLAFFKFAPPLQRTEARTFVFPPSAQDREAEVFLMIGSEGETAGRLRPNEMIVTIAGIPYTYPCGGNADTLLWDSHALGEAPIPAGETELTVEVQSVNVDTETELGASLAWIVAAVVVSESPDIELARVPLTWSYTVTNTGVIPLENIMVYAGPRVSLTCEQVTTLAPGLKMTCLATSPDAPSHAAYHANAAWVYAEPTGGGSPVVDWIEPDP